MANIVVKDPALAQKNWQTKAQAAGAFYQSGVQNPRRDWATNTAAAEPAWEAGVQGAINRRSFSSGAKKATTAKWQSGAVSKGVQRYPDGVTKSGTNFQTGITPYLATLSSIQAPARGPKGAPQNYQIVQTIGDALHQKKLALQGAA